jgi:SAM-dependent methyltransferase
MHDQPQTWHYGLVARYWAEHNTGGPEIAYFQQQIVEYGQPALDAGCGTGRLLIPFLQAGLDVDGCDVSADMLALCRARAEREGLAPQLFQQALHELDLPRRYQTIVACGVFGIGVSREQDLAALHRFHHHLLPGGVLLLEHYLPYGDAQQWPYWCSEPRQHLPEPWPETLGLEPPADGEEYQLYGRLAAFDPLEQQATRQMRTLLWREGRVVAQEEYTLTENLYFYHELRMLLAQTGFEVEAVRSDHTQAPVRADDGVVVFVARRP